MNAVEFSRGIREAVSINIENNSQFDTTVLVSEFGAYAYEVKIYGDVKVYDDQETNYHDVEAERVIFELETVYNDDGEAVDLSSYEQTLIEDNLNKNLSLEFH